MVKKILAGLSIIGFGVFSGVFVTNAITCTNTFPTSLNGYVAGNCIPSAWSNALEGKIGITGSAATSSLDYQINNIFTSYGSEQVASSAVAWINYGTASSPSSTWLKPGNNLSELTNTSTARTNLGLGDSATLASSTWLKVSNNLSDLSNTSTARTNIGFSNGTNISISGAGAIGLSGVVGTLNGGVGTSTTPSDGQYLGVNGSLPTYKNFVAGNNITITSSTTSTIIAATTNNSAAGSDQQVQYNNGGTFGATSTFTFTSSTQLLTVQNVSTTYITASNLAHNYAFSTSTTLAASTNTNVATITIPTATTSTWYDVFIHQYSNGSGFVETSTISIAGTTLTQCTDNGTGGGGTIADTWLHILMMNSTSTEGITASMGNGFSGAGTVPCGTEKGYILYPSLAFSSSTVINVFNQPSSATSHTVTITASVVAGNN